MSKKQFNYFYKHYDTIRSIIRKMYIYGCYNRNDYKEMVCGRKFDNELKRIKLVLNENNIVQSYKGKSKYTVINYDYFDEEENILIDSFYAKAFKENEFKLYFLIMLVLNDGTFTGYTVSDLEAVLGEYLKDIERITIRNHLEKLLEEGYIDCKTVGNKKRYFIPEDIFSDFDFSEMKEILSAVDFYKNTSSFKTAGYYTHETLKSYVWDKFGKHITTNSFIYKHNFLHQILDEEVMYEILKAIDGSYSLQFHYNDSPRNGISPIEIIPDEYFGRQYLLGFDIKKNIFSVFRLDKISGITSGEHKIGLQTDILKNCWSISVNAVLPQKVEIVFKFDDNTELHMVKRLFREKKYGLVEKVDDKYVFTILVSDPVEMMPWLRTFYGCIREIRNEELLCRVKEDLGRMLGVYESIQ